MKYLPAKLEDRIKKLTFTDSFVTMSGNKEVLVENVSGVYECNEIMARVRASSNEIIIWGEELKLRGYTNNSVTIYGKISSVEISAGGIKNK